MNMLYARAFFLGLAALLMGRTASLHAQEVTQSPEHGEETVTLEFLPARDSINWLAMSTARGAPTFRVRIDGVEVCGLFDTGSARTIVDLDFARERGLRISDFSRPAQALGAEISARRVWAVPVEVPNQFRLQSSMFGIDMPDIACADGMPLKFVLGSEFIAVMQIVVDNTNKRILFSAGGRVTPSGNMVRLDWQDNAVAGMVNGRPARLKVDTGSATDLLIEAAHMESFFPDSVLINLPASTAASGRREENTGLVDIEYGVGDHVITGRVKRVSDNHDPAVGNIGYRFFSNGVTIFDAGQGAIWLQPQELSDDEPL
ncbi:MAG: hypothetical protein CL955_09830 [Erythrobacteraceae bacterium]|nr:hypothetical protein [Erythrobacteraceae bacterium]